MRKTARGKMGNRKNGQGEKTAKGKKGKGENGQ